METDKMKVTFELEKGIYEAEVDKVRCGNGYYLFFYVKEWVHPLIVYDIPVGEAKIYSPKENVDSYRELKGIKSMEITA